MSSFVIHVTFDCHDPELVATFWAEVTGYVRVPVAGDTGALALEAPDHRGVRRLLFFPVPEAKTVKNRVHVDLATKDPHAEVARLIGLGATYVEHREGNGTSWTVLLDPEGNEFCLG